MLIGYEYKLMSTKKIVKITLIIIGSLLATGILIGLIVYMFKDTQNISASMNNSSSNSDGSQNPGEGGNSDNASPGGEQNELNSDVAYSLASSDGWPDGVDFQSYKDRCPDVYAWIRVPGTNIDYPIAYCDTDEPFYWDHDIDGNEDENGMIITDSLNSMDFSDPMTLIYGKTPDDGTMFSELHNFRNKDFFDSHDTVEIYLDGEKYEYKIFATYLHPNKQILQMYRFDDPLSFTDFFNSVEDIRDLSKQIRKEYWPDYEDYVITLVTHCDDEDERLFVQAMLETEDSSAKSIEE